MIRMPARGRILIRKPETEETLPGGTIIIPEASREVYAANQFEVVSVGAPEECVYPEDCNRWLHAFEGLKMCVHPLDPRIKPGAWVVARPRSLVAIGDSQYMVLQDDILGVFSYTNVPVEEVLRALTEETPLTTSP